MFRSADEDEEAVEREDPMLAANEGEPCPRRRRLEGEDLVDRPEGEDVCLAATNSCRM